MGITQIPTLSPLSGFPLCPSPLLSAHAWQLASALPGATGVRTPCGADTRGRSDIPSSASTSLKQDSLLQAPKLGGSLFIRGCRGAFCQRWVRFAQSPSPNTTQVVRAAVLPQPLQRFTGAVLSRKHMFCYTELPVLGRDHSLSPASKTIFN